MCAAVAMFVVVASPVLAQPFPHSVVAEINTQSVSSGVSSSPENFCRVNDKVFFSARHPVAGVELWKYESGVCSLVKDLQPGATDSDPQLLTKVGDRVLFFANSGVSHELWSSDGTAAGTFALRESYTKYVDTLPGSVASWNGELYYVGASRQYNKVLLATNGLSMNSVRVVGSQASEVVGPYFQEGSKLYFWSGWYGLGYTDGSTTVIEDTVNHSGASSPESLGVLNGKYYFGWRGTGTDWELWKYDPAVDFMPGQMKDLNPGATSSYPNDFTAFNGKLYFLAEDSTEGAELWVTDGTAPGTTRITSQCGLASGPSRPFVEGSKLWFFGGCPRTLYSTDGTAGNLVATTPVTPGLQMSNENSDVVLSNGKLYYTGNVYGVGRSLIENDGTNWRIVVPGSATATFLDIGSCPEGILASYGTTSDEHEPWVYNTSTETFTKVGDLYEPMASSAVGSVAAMGNQVYFSAFSPATSTKLYRSDGTAGGTAVMTNTGALGPAEVTVSGNRIYFRGEDTDGRTELFASDGTPGNVWRVKDINTDVATGSSFPSGIFAIPGNRVVFRANNKTNGEELWVSDSTEAGTYMLRDCNPGTANSFPFRFVIIGTNKLLFEAARGSSNREPFVTDFTVAGTAQLKEFNTDAYGSSFISSTASFQGKAYFNPYENPGHGPELFSTSGTAATTSLVYDVRPSDTYDPNIANLTAAGDQLFFTAFPGGSSASPFVYVTDGTTAGTVAIKELENIPSYYNFATPSFMAAIGRNVVFRHEDLSGQSMYRSDGTVAGTYEMFDLDPTSYGWIAGASIVWGNKLVYTADDGIHGGEIFWTDVNATSAVLVADVAPGPASSIPSAFASIGGKLCFSANSGTGQELHVVDLPPYPRTIQFEQTGPSSATTASAVFTFNEPVTGFAPADVAITVSAGLSHGAVAVQELTPATWRVTVAGLSGLGTLSLDLVEPAGLIDAGGLTGIPSDGLGTPLSVDTEAPTVALSATSGFVVADVIALEAVSTDAGAFGSVELWVRGPGEAAWTLASTIADAALTQPISYTPTLGSGLYRFAAVAIDDAGNRSPAPGVPMAAAIYNATLDGSITLPGPDAGGDATLEFPMGNGRFVRLTITGASPGATFTAQRRVGHGTLPSGLVAGKLLPERLDLTATGSFTSCAVDWDFDPTGLGALNLDRVRRTVGGVVLGQAPIARSGNRLTFTTTGFSTWYAEDSTASVPDWQLH